eukprot:6376508-Alexandrium_andersonii.AAC.1
MPHAADSSAPADPKGSAAVAAHAQSRRQAEVLGRRQHAQALCGTLHDARQLCLTRAKCNGLLSR